MNYQEQAKQILQAWKGDSYLFGIDVLDSIGSRAAQYGSRALLVASNRYEQLSGHIIDNLQRVGVHVATAKPLLGARPNAPREDVYRLESYILHHKPEVIIVVGGGSSIDAMKAANALAALGADWSPHLDNYFGLGKVTEALQSTDNKLIPLIAVQTSASSGAHLTKYSNITDPVLGQKKLIVDDALVPPVAFFDYSVTTTMDPDLTVDGAIDGIAHCLEVFYGANEKNFELLEQVTTTALELIIQHTKQAVDNPDDVQARESLGLATDLGGYAIMLGGTSGAHLTSFSLVDIASHGRACGILNPYYMVFFAPKVERQLRAVGQVLKRGGFIKQTIENLSGRELGLAVSKGMIAFQGSVGMPVSLGQLPGFTDDHIMRALRSAKDPQLAMKLQNMPVPLTAELVDEYMRPILEAAKTGDPNKIKNME